MHFHKHLDNRQPQASATFLLYGRILRAVESIEDASEVLASYSNAAVAHTYLNCHPNIGGLDCDTSFWRVIDSVAYQVGQNLKEPSTITHHFGKVGVYFVVEA